MASYKKRFPSENEIERMLQEGGSEGDSVLLDSENSSQSESESESEDTSEESATENSEASDEQRHQHRKEQRKRVGSGL
jgi:hypothetical protein